MIQYNFFKVKQMRQTFQRNPTPIMAPFFLLVLMLAPSLGLAEIKTLAWQDLLPELDEDLTLDDGLEWGERVRFDLDKESVRIPGFIVPLEYDDQQVVTTFLLVPYFGACIHEPPPPPNQTIYAQFEAGHKLEAIWTPVWIEGTLTTSRVEASLATASYSLSAEKIEPYEY